MARPDPTQFKSLLESARSVFCLLPQNPLYDTVASGLALKLVLDAAGKTASVICPDPVTVEFNRLVGIDTVRDSLGSRHLIIAFPDQTEHVDKVSYNLDKGLLQLVITPKPTAPDLDHRRLKFIPGQASADLLITVGVQELTQLGHIYSSAGEVISSTRLVSITHEIPRQSFAQHHLFDPDASSLSELITHLIDSLGLTFHPDAATNLFSGLEHATDQFRSPRVTHATFETAAVLLRRGARRHEPLSPASFPPGSIPTQPYTPAPPASGWGTDSQLPEEPVTEAKEPPPEWYGPKVYRGPMLP